MTVYDAWNREQFIGFEVNPCSVSGFSSVVPRQTSDSLNRR
jgi:hypothetical protein